MLISAVNVNTDRSGEAQYYFTDPVLTTGGIVFTDNYYSSLYSLNDNVQILVNTPGCGRYVDYDYSGNLIGFKHIDRSGLQFPALYDLDDHCIYQLHSPVQQCGQVRFAHPHQVFFSIEDTLYRICADSTYFYFLGYYVNDFAVSPRGNFIAYNDQNDQIWILNLSSDEKVWVTQNLPGGFCNPRWSPNRQRLAFSSLGGQIWVYDLNEEVNYSLGQGSQYCWDPSGENLIYSVQQSENLKLINSDLFISDYRGFDKIKLTHSLDDYEISPRFLTDNQIIYAKMNEPCLIKAEIVNNCLVIEQQWDDHYSIFPLEHLLPENDCYPRDSFDVPYYHQVYDVPDWFNGHWACAPTTAIMAIDYYKKLPPWDCWCTSPYGHPSSMGRYVCERYHYFSTEYNWEALDPSNNPAQGGYGFMWYGSYSPYSRMADYISQHHLNADRIDYPSFNEVVSEIDSGFPFSLCVGLTGSGHLVLALGQVSTWHTLIFNDPYGNKNTAGYPSYDGKYSRYDWPGYNNGYQNLNQVYWAVTSRGDMPAPADSIVDDLQYDGFTLYNDPPARMGYWRDGVNGYAGHYWWTYTTAAQGIDTCYATWTPKLPCNGYYHLYAWIPGDNADAQQAIYKVHHTLGMDTVILDQSQYSNQWVLLGGYQFDSSGDYVYLGDATGIQGRKIAFDALKWSFQYSSTPQTPPLSNGSEDYSWQIADGVLTVNLSLIVSSQVQLDIFDLSGRKIIHQKYHLTPGSQQVNITLKSFTPGVYFLSLNNGNRCISAKFNLLF
ncbi:MAG: hypothetical protein APR63_09755 [Desulfuromonas sp. SDB]|nr:MAG: hypothetical protein APR63_09755 [Desulfuromonas sp. SDB]